MKAVALTRYPPISDPSAFFDTELPRPSPQGRDILVEVKAVSVNPVDTKVRAPKDVVEETPKVLGFDAAGVVAEVGPEASLFAPGDEVWYAGDITRPGSNQQFQLVDERIVGLKPASLSFADAAALPLTAITAWEALFDRMGVKPDGGSEGESLLILGGAGGVGSIAIQLAKWAGLTVIASASRAETVEWVTSLGADHVINHRGDVVAEVRALQFKHLDYIAIFNDMRHWDASVELIKPQGDIVAIDNTDIALSMAVMKPKAASLHWEYMFARPMNKTPDMIEQHRLLSKVARLVDGGLVRSTVTETLRPISAATLRAAHERVESGKMIGKIVLADWA